MAKVSLANYLKERTIHGPPSDRVGPFVTISRQFGCYGFSLGLLLMEILNEDAPPAESWNIYNRQILERLAAQTNLDVDLLESLRTEKPSMVADFFRGLGGQRVFSGRQIRSRISRIIRGLAVLGYAITIGQGGAGATQDLPNGLSIRLEAPEDWRIEQVMRREGLSRRNAKAKIDRKERQRRRLRRMYQARFPCQPAFNMTYDCSAFTLTQIAQHVVCAMRLKAML